MAQFSSQPMGEGMAKAAKLTNPVVVRSGMSGEHQQATRGPLESRLQTVFQLLRRWRNALSLAVPCS